MEYRRASTGIVYLIGAGPGDPDLITVRGQNCLRQADVVVYDRLVNEALLAEAPPGAERLFAGKMPGYHSLSQQAINRILIERAGAGQVVVRLKGGDPFVFGRGGEEAAACAAAGVRWEVVPGVTSAVAVPTAAGIPVTHRHISGAFAVVTAHRANGQDAPNWAALAQIDTLVVLMGVKRLPHVVARLIEEGRAPETPVAIIERGTQADERVTIGTLADIEQRASTVGVRSPATIVIGEVVRLREQLLGLTIQPGVRLGICDALLTPA
ncbi:MAG: uroporphyrinogen-III C-methyltransferase [Chloroflexi bacterium]|nr:uroporphyrinogen-III C-methyltransferase [Chloroflexota bacterium]